MTPVRLFASARQVRSPWLPLWNLVVQIAKSSKKHSLGILLWLIAIACFGLMFKSSSEPLIEQLEGTRLESWLQQFQSGNPIVLDLSVGVLISLAMYLLIVWLPQEQTRKRVRRNLQNHYDLFKEECIYQLLFATENAVDPELVERLADVRHFRDYFKANGPNGSERWYDVMNGLEPQHVRSIAMEMGVLAEEIKFTLASIDVQDDEVFKFLKRLNRTIIRLRESCQTADVEYLTNFLWELFAAWSFATGYQEADFVTERLGKV